MRIDSGSSERVSDVVREFLEVHGGKMEPSAWQEELGEQRLGGELGESLKGVVSYVSSPHAPL